jgi:hypothetical protein
MPRLLAVVAVLLTTAAELYAQPLPQYDVSVRVDAEARTASGHARIVVTNPTDAPLGELWLWRYPERFASRSRALNDYNFYWVYPYRFNPGHMRTGPVLVDGRAAAVEVRDHPQAGPGTLLHVALDPPLGPGARATVDVDYTLELPRRFGPFGCVGGDCTLTGFYPMVAPPGFGLDAVPGRGDYTVHVGSAHVADVVVNGELRAVTPRVGPIDLAVGAASGLTVMVGRPRLRRYERVERGVKIVLLAPHSRGLPSPPQHVLPYQPANRIDRVLDTAAEAIDLLDEWGLKPRPDEEVRIVEGGLRIELCQSLPGVIFASDRLFDIFPLNRFLKFHEFELARAVFEQLLTRRLFPRERADDLGWSPGAGAAYLVDLYTLRSYRKAEFAREILAWASFIPAIDRVMYAPQVPFASSYFYTLEDPDPLRDSLSQFNNMRPTGKTLYTKLTDLLSTARVDQLTRAQMRGEPIRAGAEALHQGTLDWFWRQWLRRYPYVDYRFADVRSERLGKHLWRVTARVSKVGPEPPVEPVEVRAVDVKGRAETQTWDGQASEHTYVFQLAAPLSVIEIDPRGRLVEDLPGSNDDLKFNDRRPPRWKFVYNNFGGLVRFFPTLGIDLSLDFSLSRILDLKQGMRFVIYRSDSTQVGVIGSYTRAFGHKVTQARLTSAFTWTVGASRINPSFGQSVSGTTDPGTTVSASMGFSYDDRLFVWEPWRALSLGASLGAVETVLDNGTVLSQGTASAGWESIVPVADSHGLAFTIGAAATFGDLRIPRQMLSPGGGSGLRGYDVATLLGRWYAYGRAEYRHIFVHNLDVNLAHSFYLRGIGGGLFAEAGVVSPCDSYAPDHKSAAVDVGYSLRLFADWFGVSQTTVNLDFAVPLVSNARACQPLGAMNGTPATPSTPLPFGFFFSFGPPW